MGLRTPEEYVESLRRQSPEVYARGEIVTNVADHPLFAVDDGLLGLVGVPGRVGSGAARHDGHVARPERRGVATSSGTWRPSPEDLLQNLRAARMLSERSPLSGYASIGRDELQALLIVTQRVDRAHGTSYHERVVDFVKRFQREQLMTAAAVTDVKGDRAKRPADQDDPDLYLRVVERRSDGIVVRGAKAHTSGSVVANELVIIPQRAMRADDADYAVAFAVPVDTPGIKLVCRGFSRREPGRVRGAGLEPRRPDGVVHDLRRRVRAVGARVPLRRGGVRGRGREHVRQRQPAGLPRRRRRQAAPVHRRRAARRPS